MSLFKKSLDTIGPLMGLGVFFLWVGGIGAVLADEDALILVLPLILLLGVAYGWILFVYIHYRQGRQDEFLNLLTTVAESGAPLVPALRAYLLDRPRRTNQSGWPKRDKPERFDRHAWPYDVAGILGAEGDQDVDMELNR